MATDNAYFVQEGEVITYSNTGSAIAAKEVVVIVSGTSGRIGIAINDIAATSGTGPVAIAGTWNLPKTTGQAYVIGALVYWDDSANKVSSTASGNTRAGRVTQAYGSAATSCDVMIDQF